MSDLRQVSVRRADSERWTWELWLFVGDRRRVFVGCTRFTAWLRCAAWTNTRRAELR